MWLQPRDGSHTWSRSMCCKVLLIEPEPQFRWIQALILISTSSPQMQLFFCRAPLRKHYGRGLIGSSHLALLLTSALIFHRFEHNSEASLFTLYLQGSVCTSFQLLAHVFVFISFFFRFYSYLCDLFGVTLDPFQHPVKISFLNIIS